MSITYEEWCENNTNIAHLVSSLKSSLPEQYIGFYLYKVFGNEVEYQKQFDWLGRCSLDIYIPLLQLAIEYDGEYYHRNKSYEDAQKTYLCRSHGIYLIHIQEMTSIKDKTLKGIEQSETSPEGKKYNEISYYCQNKYKNIDIAISDLFAKINKEYGTEFKPDVDLNRDREDIASYIRSKYYKLSVAYAWPEIVDYWDCEDNKLTIFDVLREGRSEYNLKCPHCGRKYFLRMRYSIDRLSLDPCECEYEDIENDLTEAVRKYSETGEAMTFDDSLRSRRLYDKIVTNIKYIEMESKLEAELYKRAGFDSWKIDAYLKNYDKWNSEE